MGGLLADLPVAVLLGAAAIATLAGFVKGAVGFALPMIMISGLGSFLPAETALAALILPTVTSNIVQSLRGGWRAAVTVVRRFWIFLLTMLVFLGAAAQLVALVSTSALFLIIGGLVMVFAMSQLAGFRLHLTRATRVRDELAFGTVAGTVGGLSGVWGPPTVAYLVAIDEEKRSAVRIQGVIYGFGAVMLLAAHLRSGVLNAESLPLSAAAVVPVFAGLWLGMGVHDRLPQESFRRAMLVVLTLAGLNLIRRGLMG